MDKVTKALKKLSTKEREELKGILSKIKKGELVNFDLKKLKNRGNIFRIRKGKMRIIFYKKDASIKILSLERRGDTTYTFKL